MDLFNYVRVYDNALPEDFCKDLIGQFEKFTDKHERHDNGGYPNFTQLNLTRHFQTSKLHKFLIERALHFRDLYVEDTNARLFPMRNGWEEIRMKKYNNDGVDRFDEHVDAEDINSCKRFLVMFWYLNDVEEGGETIFTDPINVAVKPKTGRVLMFPPMWMYPHAGAAPKSNPKYIIGSYLHYA